MSSVRIRLGASDLIELGRAKCGPGKIRRAAYMTKSGKRVKSSCVKDTGLPGKTSLAKRVLPPIVPGFLHGWKKDMPEAKRHAIIAEVTRAEGCVSAIRRLNLLSIYTRNTSPETAAKAHADMNWVRGQSFCKLKSKERKK